MAKSLDERLKAMAEKAATQRKAVEQEELAQPACVVREPVQGVQISEEELVACFFPFLPDPGEDRRAMANAILRSSLFAVVGKGKHKYEKNVQKVVLKGLSLSVTGEQLDQSDLDVFLECLHRHQGVALGELVRFTANSFLNSLNRKNGRSDYKWLEGVLSKLVAYSIELDDGRRTYQGPLLQKKYRDKETLEYVIVVNPDWTVFFVDGLWTSLDVEDRQTLKGKQLALWLHGFYSSHEKPFPYKVKTLKDLCGSVAVTKEFRRTLKKAIKDLTLATGWTCNIDPQTDLVHVVKTKAAIYE